MRRGLSVGSVLTKMNRDAQWLKSLRVFYDFTAWVDQAATLRSQMMQRSASRPGTVSCST
jgi:hypothetical protein